jgi:hypothetical protein
MCASLSFVVFVAILASSLPPGHVVTLAAMPPKKRKASGPGAGPARGSSGKAAASSLAQPAPEEEHLLGDLADTEGGKRRRQLGRRDSDEAVERSIQKHFSAFSQIDLETQRVKGQTLRERIRSDRHKLPKGGRLGSTYWRDLVQEWSTVSSGIGDLHPEVKDCWALKSSSEPWVHRFVFVVWFGQSACRPHPPVRTSPSATCS